MAKGKIIRRITNAPSSGGTERPEQIQNGLGEAIGLQQSPFPFGGTGFGNYGPPGMGSADESVSDTTTLFTNLRWYLVSNFRQLLTELYVEIGLVKTIVDVPVDDGLRGGVDIKTSQLSPEQIKELKASVDRDDDINTIGYGAKWNRLFGGAGILILVGDQDPETPLDIEALSKEETLQFRAVDMWELFWDKQNTEGYDPEIQTESFEFYDYYAERVHKSRVMRMKGPIAPSFIRPRLRGWGFSVVENLVRSINQYLKATDLSFEVLDEFKIDVYKIKNLVNTLLSPNGTNKIRERVQMANLQKNYQHAVVMDSEDDWDHKQLSFAGLAEAQAGIRKQVCTDLRMPATKLFGSSEATGLGNADQNDMENYNSMVEGEVRNKIKYDILRLLELKCQWLFGMVPTDLEIEFKPLRILSAVDEETVKTQKFQRLAAAKAAGDISTEEYRHAANKGHLFDVELDVSPGAIMAAELDAKDVALEGDHEAGDTKDTADPGANREDSRSPTAMKELSSVTLEGKTRSTLEGTSHEKGAMNPNKIAEAEKGKRDTDREGFPVNDEPKNKTKPNKARTLGAPKHEGH
jgi:phage-related protein (TIGR01555 family)